MRIAFVCGHYDPYVGGVEEHVLQLTRRLVARGHDVAVLTHHESIDGVLPPRREVLDSVDIERFAVSVPARHLAVSTALLRRLRASRGSHDVVHAHGYHTAAPLAVLLSGARPYVFTPHYHGTGHGPLRRAIHPAYRAAFGRRIFTHAAATIAVADNEARLIRSHVPEIGARLTVIPNGVDVTRIRAAAPFPKAVPVVLSAGRLETYKQVDVTIRALEHLPESVTLKITGDGPARPDLERLTAERGLCGRVQFLGRIDVEILHRWFRTAGVYVSMSSNEAMPITLLEVLAGGARVVASDIPAHREVAERTGGSVTIVPLNAAPKDLATAIGESMRHEPALPTIPSWDWVVEQTEALYRRVID